QGATSAHSSTWSRTWCTAIGGPVAISSPCSTRMLETPPAIGPPPSRTRPGSSATASSASLTGSPAPPPAKLSLTTPREYELSKRLDARNNRMRRPAPPAQTPSELEWPRYGQRCNSDGTPEPLLAHLSSHARNVLRGKMRLDPRWIVLDLADTGTGDMMVHSIGGKPCERTMRRAVKAGELRLDLEGALAVMDYAKTRASSLPDVHAEHHVVVHPEYGPTAIAIWLHPGPPSDRPVLNSWVLDLDELTTVTAGDDVSLIGDGRRVGEHRPVQDLWRWLSPPDAAALVMDYKRAIVEPDNAWTGIEWTLHPPDARSEERRVGESSKCV